jgi:hypothetical protein
MPQAENKKAGRRFYGHSHNGKLHVASLETRQSRCFWETALQRTMRPTQGGRVFLSEIPASCLVSRSYLPPGEHGLQCGVELRGDAVGFY